MNNRTYLRISAIMASIELSICIAFLLTSEGITNEAITSTVLLGITILSNLGIFLIVSRKEVENVRGILNILSGIEIFLGNVMSIMFGVINIIIINKKSKEEKSKTKLELPKLPEIKDGYLTMIFTVVMVLAYSTTHIWIGFLKEYINEDNGILIYIFSFVVVTIIFRKNLVRDFKYFKKNISTYLEYIIPKLGIFLVGYLAINMVAYLVIGEDSQNQLLLKELPIGLLAVLGIIYAPFVEEIIYRGFIKKIIKNRATFILLSGFIFGALHVIGIQPTNVLQYLYIFSYMWLGCSLAYLYYKTDNIFTTMTCHFIINILGTLAIFLSQNSGVVG